MQDEKPIDVLCMGVVRGTPRTYGDTKNDDIWRRTIAEGNWEGLETLVGQRIPLHLDFTFRVNPRSPSYRGRRWDSGPDLDTMVIGALGGLLHCRNPLRPTLRLIQEGGLCRMVTATKTVIDNDEISGFTLHLRAGDVVPYCEPSINPGISFSVIRHDLKKHRRRAVQLAAESQNPKSFRAPRGTRIEISLTFAAGMTRNPLSADWLEAVIDGLGACHVGTERFFDGPPTQEFGYDDSVVFKLTIAHVSGLPSNIGLHVDCANIDSSDAINTC
jgi:hypothetical protein